MRLVQLKDGEKMAMALKNKIIKSNKENKYIFDFIIDDIKNNCLKNTFIYNEGGIGKTTQLKKLVQMLLSPEGREYEPSIIPIYIAVKDLHGSKKENILFNSIKKFCGEDSSDEELKNLLDGSSSLREDVIFFFIIDGLNEAKNDIKNELQKEINDLMDFEQNIFIVSSRIDETKYFSGFEKKFYVKPLDNVCDILNVQKNAINPKLLEILSIPLYLKYYLDTYKKDDFDFYKNKSVKKSDILKEYLKAIDKNYDKSTVSYDKYTKDFLIDFYLPALAYELEISNEITDEKLSEIKKYIASYSYYNRLLKVDEEDEIGTVFKANDFFPLKISKEWFALNDKKGYFVHDIWQDYFTALYYSKCIDKDIIEVFDNLPLEEVREFIGEITGECDFENVTELEEAKKSPLNQFLQRHNLQQSLDTQLSDMQTRNIIEIMKTSRNNNITADYSYLNLLESNFLKTDFSNSVFNNSRFGELSFIPPDYFDLNRYGYIDLFFSSGAMSPDGRYMVQSSKGNIQIIEVDTNNFVHRVIFDESIPIYVRQIIFLDEKTFIVNYEYLLAVFVIEYPYVECIAVYPFDVCADAFDLLDEEKVAQSMNKLIGQPRPRMKYLDSILQKKLEKACGNFENDFDELLNYYNQFVTAGAKEVDFAANNAVEQLNTNIDIQLKSGNYFQFLDLITTLVDKQNNLDFDNSFKFETAFELSISVDWCLSPMENKMHIAVNNDEKKVYFVSDGCLYQFDYAGLLKKYKNNDDLDLIKPEKLLQNSNIDLLLNWKNKGLIGISAKSWGLIEKENALNGSYLSYYDINSKKFSENFFEDKYICDVDCYKDKSDIVSFMFAEPPEVNTGFYRCYNLKSNRLVVDLSTLEETNEENDMKRVYNVELINNCFTQTIDYTISGNNYRYHCFASDNSYYGYEAYYHFRASRNFYATLTARKNCFLCNSITDEANFAIAGYSYENDAYHKVTDYYSELQYNTCHVEIDKYNNIQIYCEDVFGNPYWYDVNLNNDKYIIGKIPKHEKMNEELIDENVNDETNWHFLSEKVRNKFNDFISTFDLDVNVSVRIYPKRNYLILYNDDYYFSDSKGSFIKMKNKDNTGFCRQYCVRVYESDILAVFDLETNCLAYINSSDLDLSLDKLRENSLDKLQVCFYDDNYLSVSRNGKTYIFSKSEGESFCYGVLWKKINKYLGWSCLKNVSEYFLYRDGYLYINNEELKYVVPKNNQEATIHTLGNAKQIISNHTDILCTVFNNELSIWDLRKMGNNPSELKPVISNLNMNFVNEFVCRNASFKNIKGLTTYQKEQLSLLGVDFE